jgi:hypothetical protein
MATRAQSKAIVEDLYPEPTMRRRMLDSMNSGVGVGVASNGNMNNSASKLSENIDNLSSSDEDASSDEGESSPTSKMKQDIEMDGNRSASNIRAIQNFFQQPFLRRRSTDSGGPLARRRSNDSGGPYGNHANAGTGYIPDFDVRANADDANDHGPIAMQFESPIRIQNLNSCLQLFELEDTINTASRMESTSRVRPIASRQLRYGRSATEGREGRMDRTERRQDPGQGEGGDANVCGETQLLHRRRRRRYGIDAVRLSHRQPRR